MAEPITLGSNIRQIRPFLCPATKQCNLPTLDLGAVDQQIQDPSRTGHTAGSQIQPPSELASSIQIRQRSTLGQHRVCPDPGNDPSIAAMAAVQNPPINTIFYRPSHSDPNQHQSRTHRPNSVVYIKICRDQSGSPNSSVLIVRADQGGPHSEPNSRRQTVEIKLPSKPQTDFIP
ncbi:hypothetical protein ACLOJK_004385, partial [Asimina triloba]